MILLIIYIILLVLAVAVAFGLGCAMLALLRDDPDTFYDDPEGGYYRWVKGGKEHFEQLP